MHRPTRIIVFGVICLLFGGFILLHNLQQLGVALAGPQGVDVEAASQLPGQLGTMMRDTSLALQSALAYPVFRAGLGLKSLASAGMGGMLIAIGIGLLRDQAWSLKLAKIWALYAIASALFITVLQSVYLVPNIPLAQNSAGAVWAQYVGMAFMFILLCIFPLLLIKLLPSKSVCAYLNKQVASSAAMPINIEPTTSAPAARPVANPRQASSPDLTPQQTTWRDDPWNDPSN